jgi:hypothetical protein
MTDRQAHSDVQRAALQSVNDTIAHSTALSNITRQLSADAVQIRCAFYSPSVSRASADSAGPLLGLSIARLALSFTSLPAHPATTSAPS